MNTRHKPLEGLRLLWHSNAPYVGTGYGTQTGLFAPRLARYGAEVTVSAFYGLRGAALLHDGLRLLPGGLTPYGVDIIERHAQMVQAEIVWTLIDVWVIPNEILQRLPTACWAPVDHSPLPPQVRDALQHARWPVSYSRSGLACMLEAGLRAEYVPHAVDTAFWEPRDRASARAAWGVEEDSFLAVSVAANKGYPDRKNLNRLLKAWAAWVENHPGAVLYLHTQAQPHYHGLDLAYLSALYGCGQTVRLADATRLQVGSYGPGSLRDLYNAADVLLLPSMGEGFGLPLLEAQACGCPVVTTDFTAMSELCFGGYLLELTEDNLQWTLQDSYQACVRPRAIMGGLDWAWENRGNEQLREEAREGAMEYDVERVLDRYFVPVLCRMREETTVQELVGS